VVSTVWESAPTAVGVVARTARTTETDASEGMADEMFKTNDESEGDPLAYETSEVNDKVEKAVSDCAVVEEVMSEMVFDASELAELVSVPSAKLATTLTVEVSYEM
jgi:hypothetical protein